MTCTSYKSQITNHKRGFTLVELLVVVGVLGILASLALVSYTGAQKQGRDTQRKSDLKQYQTALEIFANKNSSLYPSRTTTVNASGTFCSTDLSLTVCPEDPRNSEDATYVYNYQSNGTGAGSVDATQYVLWSKLENPDTTTYFVLCSTGAAGEATSGIPPTGGVCPL